MSDDQFDWEAYNAAVEAFWPIYELRDELNWARRACRLG